MKKCFKCGETKSLSEYYNHKKMADGLLGKCKECTKNDATEHRLRNLERVREYDRQRGFRGKSRRHEPGKNKWAKNNKGKKSAMQRAIRKHKEKQPCSVCGISDLVHRHHDDYLIPLEIIWLCPKHHGERHRAINKIERQLGYVHPNTRYY